MKITSATKSQIAGWYNCAPDTLRRWLLEAGLHFGRRKILRANEIAQIIDVLGPPSKEIDG
ncbi:hypothetical protein [Hymenobacter glacieicola]|uniref:DUF4248 domain-containing protein n=1 Tax=Hymenobacter glacieicola TaxID=1562124 RepID=A0ABQ1X539_9BACT|nr:hypothetical protein [Hymenobacter glacieicola]GGG60449.1 hypothetical protein GCM10011378_40550 [Hymenobacter glacieicola]